MKEKWVSYVRSKIQLWNNIPQEKKRIDEDLKSELRNYYKSDVKKLEKMLNLNLKEWY